MQNLSNRCCTKLYCIFPLQAGKIICSNQPKTRCRPLHRSLYQDAAFAIDHDAYSNSPSAKSKRSTTFERSFATLALSGLRRPRKYESKIKEEASMPNFRKGLEEPYAHKEQSLEDYIRKASLSPWTPVPDVVARKALEIAQAGPDDIHVDLGSGDGRVNFHAIDLCNVSKSIGIDIDENIVAVAKTRLLKRHPQPPIEFIVADLLDPFNKAWEHVQNATIITMFFATDGLKVFRPLLEQKLVGRTCKIICIGYEMPGWTTQRVSEVVLGTQIHMYYWGASPYTEDELDDVFVGDDLLPTDFRPQDTTEKFNGSNVIDHTGKFPIRGFNPDLLLKSDNYDDEDWGSDSDSDSDERKSETTIEK